MEFTEAEKQVISRWKRTEAFKMEDVSDICSIRRCYKAAKELYECLKFFDNRVSRFQYFKSATDKKYQLARSFHAPDDYYTFRFFDVVIQIRKDFKRKGFICVCYGFHPVTFPILESLNDGNTFLINPTPHLGEAKDVFMRLVSEFIAKRFDSYGLF